VVLPLLFSAGLVAVLYTLEPREIVTCRGADPASADRRKRRTSKNWKVEIHFRLLVIFLF
jgi:hypothetical protein